MPDQAMASRWPTLFQGGTRYSPASAHFLPSTGGVGQQIGLAKKTVGVECVNRLKLLKIGARIRITVRKVWLSFSEAYPYTSDFAQILANLQRYPARAPPG